MPAKTLDNDSYLEIASPLETFHWEEDASVTLRRRRAARMLRVGQWLGIGSVLAVIVIALQRA